MARVANSPYTDRDGLVTLAALAAGVLLPYLTVWLSFEVLDLRAPIRNLGPLAPQMFNALILSLSGLTIGGGIWAGVLHKSANPGVVWGKPGFRRYWLFLAPVLLFAATSLTALAQGEGAEAAAEVTTGALASGEAFSWLGFLLLLATAGLLVPAAEELAFRGVLYPWLRGRMGVQAAILVTGFLFGICHVQPDLALRAAVLGMVLALIRERSGSLWPCIAAHAVNNSLAVVVHQAVRFL
jgi:membrane protease YdiL (CAAX protease family)